MWSKPWPRPSTGNFSTSPRPSTSTGAVPAPHRLHARPEDLPAVAGGRGYVKDHVEKEYDAGLLADVQRLHVYATVCKVLRNHIHDGILPVNQHPGRATATP